MTPLSTEPVSFGQKRDIIDWEKERLRGLLKKKPKQLSYRKELRRLHMSLMARHIAEHNWRKRRVRYSDPWFQEWVRKQLEYSEFIERMKRLNIKIPGRKN